MLRVFMGAFLALVLTGCTPSVESDSNSGNNAEHNCNNQAMGAPMCDFQLMDQNGDQFKLSDYVGTHILIDISAVWCSACQTAAGEVQSVQDQFREYDFLYVTILAEDAIGDDPGLADVDDWSQLFGISSPVLIGSANNLGYQPDQFNVNSWPAFWYVDDDEDQTIMFYHTGWSNKLIDNNIRVLLNQ